MFIHLNKKLLSGSVVIRVVINIMEISIFNLLC